VNLAIIRNPIPVKLICGITFSPELNLASIIEKLETVFSSVEQKSTVFNFSDFTSYYEEEMGKNLSKVFIAFYGFYDPGSLAECKVRTTVLEQEISGEHRKVNLDPGYITPAKLVLATAKDFAHRIYLGQGIYGDVQYRFRRGKFEPSAWTYPDYQTELAVAFFSEIRQNLLKQEHPYDPIVRL
jgi:hypothetical protein